MNRHCQERQGCDEYVKASNSTQGKDVVRGVVLPELDPWVYLPLLGVLTGLLMLPYGLSRLAKSSPVWPVMTPTPPTPSSPWRRPAGPGARAIVRLTGPDAVAHRRPCLRDRRTAHPDRVACLLPCRLRLPGVLSPLPGDLFHLAGSEAPIPDSNWSKFTPCPVRPWWNCWWRRCSRPGRGRPARGIHAASLPVRQSSI